MVSNGQILTKLDNGQEVGYLPALSELALLKGNAAVAIVMA